MEIPIPILSAVIGALSAMLVILVKEVVDRKKTSRLAALCVAWLAQSLRQSLSFDASILPHLDLSLLKSSAADIARLPNLRQASFMLQEVYCLWKGGAYRHKHQTDPVLIEASGVLDKVVALCE